MPVSALVTTAGSATANGFCTTAFVTQYMLDRPGFASSVAWAAATADEKTAAVIYMTRILCARFYWNGNPVTQTQALAFPRYGMVNRNGYLIDSTTIPIEIQEATAEGAAQLLLDAATDAASGETPQAQGLKRLKAGPVELEFSETSGSEFAAFGYGVLSTIPAAWGYAYSSHQSTRRLVRA